MAVLRKIYLLFWKNLVLLKRQYIVTACEILLPTLFTIALAYLRSRVQPVDSSYGYEPPGSGVTTFPEYTEQDMVQKAYNNIFNNYYSTSNIIGYTPKSPGAFRIMEELVDRIEASYPEPTRFNKTRVNITGFASEGAMEAFDLSTQMDYSYPRDEFLFGIVFSGLSDTAYPNNHKISYKIRIRGYFNTKDLFPYDFTSGPGYSYDNYFYYMFSGLQLLIDKILIEKFTGQAPEYTISQQGFPYPEYKDFDIDDLYYIFLPQFIVLGFVFVVPSIVRGAVSEKETGIKELMKMSGLPEWMHWLGWMLNSLTVLIITVTLIVILLFVPFNSAVGAVFKHSDFTLVWCVLMLYAIWATSYCFTVSAFFEKPTLATTIGIVVWIVSFYGLGLAMEESYGKDLALGIKLLLCIFPNVAIHLALKAICVFEAAEKGAKWGNMGDALSAVDSMTLLYTVLMLLISICLNIFICLYVEAVLPKKYGVRKPFYYMFLPSEWGFGRKKRENDSYEKSNEEGSKPGFEDAPHGIKAGVEIRKLRKEFGKAKVAVNDVSVNIYEGQIFCLLGQNGAGKTTSMSILTGLFAPTSGTALINGYDIRTDMEKIRRNLGLCPQHNMLFDKLTVQEHLKFFGMLKGMSAKEASDETMGLLKLLQIEEKIDELSTSLSGGQKRRLSLGCALIGGSKVIFLDEPTSGMDPEARRAIWDLLLRIRGERTIVLTTHFMEEADVLGDRIAIMASGTLQCCGSPSFLKRFYGAGYTLAMTIVNGANQDSILSTVRGHVEDAHFKTQLSNNANELSIILPSDNSTSSKFPALFSELTDKQKELGIDEIGVGWTTMDEVFIRVEELSRENFEDGNPDTESQSLTSAESKEEMIKPRASSGMALLVGQFGGLFMKKLMYSFRRKRLILSQMVIPVLLTIAAVVISTVVTSTKDTSPPLTITLDSYKDPVTLYSSRNETIGNIYASVVGSSGKRLDSRFNYDVSEGILDVGRKDISFYRERHIIAAEINDTHMKGLYSTIPFHSAPLTMNVLANTLLRGLAPDKGYYIETINHPFQNTFYELLRPIQPDPEFVTIVAIMFGVMIPIGLALLASSYLIAPTEERLCQGKQLQMMTGVNPVLYWFSMFLCDYFLLLVTVCLMTACLPIFEDYKTFTNHNGAGVIFLVMAVYGLATISFSYVFSTFVRSVAGGFSLLTIIHIFTGVGLGIAAYLFEDLDPGAGYLTALNVIGRIFPTFGVTKGAITYAEIASGNSKCSRLTQKAKDILCSPTFNLEYFSFDQGCCDNCEELGTVECFKPEPFLKWTKEVPYYDNSIRETRIVNLPALTQDIVWLGLIAIINFAVLMLVEYDVFQMLWEKISKKAKSTYQTFNSTVDDIDVLEENQRVHNLVSGGRASDDAIVVENLCKSFGVFAAVSKLNFGVHHGECFGLLGVNGAGKTTSFRMLTGDETRSSGNAYMNSLSLVNGRKEFLSKLGYCPQFDGIIGVLTGKEMLRLFARLRGIPGNRVNDEADKWLRKAGLAESGNVQCQKYSGGMKRRLSAAMALIGDPPVILLDEPTSGVDPVARRRFWKIISSIKNSGQAIVLTSHSMEECEALCGRLAIMVNGEIQCFGGVQHLKNKFAQGYSLSIKLKEQCLQNPTVVDSITHSVCQTFDPCYLKDHHQISMKFQIQSKSRMWDELYRTMEAIKMQFIDAIEEYAITETTLEEVFLSFARKQYVNERVTNSKGLLRFCRLPC